MGEISAYASQGSKSPARRPEAGSKGADVSEGSWNGTVISFEDLKARPSPGGGAVVVNAASSDGKVRRSKKSGRHFLRRTGWQAQLQRILVVTSEREVAPSPDGRFRPQGPWAISSIDEYAIEGTAKERTGDVIDDSENMQFDSRSTGAASTSADVPSSEAVYAEAHGQLQYLPHAVRKGLTDLVPSPTFFQCQAVRHSSPEGDVSRHSVSALRMSEDTAVAIQASRQHGSRHWQVQQLQYRLAPRKNEASLPSSTGRGIA